MKEEIVLDLGGENNNIKCLQGYMLYTLIRHLEVVCVGTHGCMSTILEYVWLPNLCSYHFVMYIPPQKCI